MPTRSSPWLLVALAPLAACGPAHLSASIARVEHGLIPVVRIAGETRGWSIEERLRVHHVPAVSIAVIHQGRVAWARAYGVRDRRTGESADTETLFQAASISKMVTALAALRAVDAGQVALDADINRALRGWRLPDNDLTRGHPVTLRQLLTHTAGTNVRSVIGHPPRTPLPTLRQILDGQPPANTPAVRVVHRPGAGFHYSGGGSLIVQQLIVDVSGRPFADAMRERVFAPLGLSRTTFEAPPPAAALARAAAAHDYDETVLPEIVYPESAPAGLWSTPRDLARLLVEIQRAGAGRSALLSRAMAAQMTTPAAPIGVPDVSTGLGTFVERHGDALYFGHDGWNDGFLSVSRASVQGGEGAVIMTNGANATPLILEILRSIAAEYRWRGWLAPPVVPAQVAPARLRALAGRYAAGFDRSLEITVRGDRLEAREPFRAPIALVPLAADTFISADERRFRFRRGAAGQDELVQRWDGDEVVRVRVTADAAEPLRLLEEGRDAEALAAYRSWRVAHADDPALAAERFDELAAELLDRRLDPTRAIALFRIEVALYPESPNAQAGLALALLRAGRRAEAAPVRARALALHQGARERGSEMEEIFLGARIGRLR